MNTFWNYLWPSLAAAVVIGLAAGLIAARRPRKGPVAAIGLAIAFSISGVWHWPGGAAERFVAQVERDADRTLRYYEMDDVQARLDRGPLTRRMLLSGPADDFQQAELVRILSDLSGVSRASWSRAHWAIPLIAEGALAALFGYLVGLFLAYLVVLHRRYNAQWEW